MSNDDPRHIANPNQQPSFGNWLHRHGDGGDLDQRYVDQKLSGDYPLHQMVFIRSAIGILFSLILVQVEGGFNILKTKTPGLHALRGILIVCSNLTYFTALAVVPLADATALFFVAPLMITLLSIPILGKKSAPIAWAPSSLVSSV